MKCRDLLRISVSNTLRNRRKTILSSMAVAIGIASLLLITAVGNSVYAMAELELSRLGIDGLSLRRSDSEQAAMNPRYAELLQEEVPGVRAAMPFQLKYSSSKLLGKAEDAVLWGIGANMVETMDLKLLYGREINQGDLTSHARVAVLDEAYAQSMYHRSNIVGKQVRLYMGGSWNNYEIIGIIASQTEALRSMVGVDLGTFLYVPYTTMNEAYGESGVEQIAIRCEEMADAEVVAEQAKLYMMENDAEESRYHVENITGYLEQVKRIVGLIRLLVAAIGSISLVVAGVGVMNGMLASIDERRREIGIYLSVGAMPWDMIGNILLESIFICLFGGIVGSFVGLFGAELLCRVLGLYVVSGLRETVLGIVISCACGVVFGVIPALKAAGMDPIRALNRE